MCCGSLAEVLQGGSVDKAGGGGALGGRTADAFRSWWRGEEGVADVWTAMQI